LTDEWNLQRFVDAQNDHGTYEQALQEIRNGLKASHWMWFVFPQHVDLGRSSTAKHYGISGLEEARAYLAHPVLGPRLLECVDAVLRLTDSPEVVFGGIDAVKLRSSMTLFRIADPDETRFGDVLDKFYDRVPDSGTLMALRWAK
jgi:uncharacterized protein (DUF1810 family)